MQVRLYQPAKTAMQSGRAKTARWLIEYEPETPNRPDPLMGWISGDTLNQVRIPFETEAEARAFAEKKGWSVLETQPNMRRVRPKNYLQNFNPDRVR